MKRSFAKSALAILLVPLAAQASFTKNPPAPRDENARDLFDKAAIKAFSDDFGKSLDRLSLSVVVDPFQPVLFVQDANARVTPADLDGAIRDYDEALKISSDDVALHLGRGAAYFYKGNLQSALEDFDKACKLAPANADAVALRGATRAALQDFAGAKRDFEDATRLRPDDSSLWSDRAAVEATSVLVRYRADPNLVFDRTFAPWKESDFAPAMKTYARALEINPNEIRALYSRAFLRMVKGDGDGAVEDMRRVVEINQSNNPADQAFFLNGLGMALGRAGDHEAAIATFDKALEIRPNSFRTLNNRATEKFSKGDLAGAKADLNKSVELAPTYMIAYLNRGFVKMGKGETAQAIEDFNKAMEMPWSLPLTLGALTARANAKAESGDVAGSEKDYARAIELDPENPATYIVRAHVRLSRGDLDGAERDVKKAYLLSPDNASCFLLRGGIKAQKGDNAGAIVDYGRAIEINPKDATAYINRGMARTYTKDWKGAASDAEKVISLKPEYADLAQAYFLLGVAIEGGSQDREKSAEQYRRAIQINPRHDMAYWKLGFTKTLGGDRAGAILEFNKALEINPRNPFTLMDRGAAKAALGDYTGGMADFDAAIAINPKESKLYGQRGAAKQDHGDYDGAIADYEAELKLNPKNELVRSQIERCKVMKSNGGRLWDKDYGDLLAQAQKKLEGGDRSGAVALLEQAVKKNPKVSVAYSELGQIKAVNGDLQGGFELLGKAIEVDPTDFVSHARRGNILLQTGNPRAALADFDVAVMCLPHDALPLVCRAMAHGNLGDLDGAEKDLDAAEKLQPGFPQIPVVREKIDALRKGQLPQPSQVSPEVNAQVEKLVQSAWSMAEQGDLNGALAEGNKALALNPADSRTHTFLARVKNAQGDAAGALAECEQALAIEPNNFMAYSMRSMIKIDKADWAGVIEDSSRALAINPQDVFSYLNRGKAKANTRDFDGAIADYDRGIMMLNPPDPRAFAERGMVKTAKQDWNGAVSDYDEALKLAPNDPGLLALKDKAKAHQP
ncbi:MAG: tetratricopeptide repeat protein [bacterium]